MSLGELRSVEVGGRKLTFYLRRSNRRTMSISVEPDQRVVVIAPVSTQEERIAGVVRRRAHWIHRQQRTFEDMPPPAPARQWVSGESHRYLGRQYRLKVTAGAVPSVRLSGAFFIVTTPQPTVADVVAGIMIRWYRVRAKAILRERVERLLMSTIWLKLPEVPPLIVRSMRQRWGSATPAGRLYFNVDLVKMPLGCIDYVVAHEVAHLKIPNHGSAFWRLLSRLCPEWERARKQLVSQHV